MTQEKGSSPQSDTNKQRKSKQPLPGADEYVIPKPESSAEYEGAPNERPTGKPKVDVKTQTSSSSGE